MQDIAEYKKGPFGSSVTVDMFVEKGENTYKVYEQKNAINADSTLGWYYLTERDYRSLQDFSVRSGDIIVSCAGTIGKCYILPENTEPGIINQALMRVRIKKGFMDGSVDGECVEGYDLSFYKPEIVKYF